ncbi:TRAP transporter large permease subunit [Piscinibacter gummiphilus]|uniref:TRAP transporter large permease protein n=1 Tax=Piscinibacter gummiphilus TaxID=946333 RepID=A0ABZ0CWQ9_9BURK|nr:TRAP transporter large permease subunit [Piscinibacter gummiphilus]WOB08946.1 TRAP transporter large permease subunit [Piscinibacter gummiphilus]
MDILTVSLLIAALIAVLASGFWIGLSLLGVAAFAMNFFTQRMVGDSMAFTIWGSTSSWTLTALPLFLWMGEILFRSRLTADLFRGLAPWLNRVPGRLLHANVIGCGIFAAVSGSSAATCATIGKITLPELKKRGYPDDIAIGSLAGAGTFGLMIPPSIIMIVYAVATDVSIAKLFVAGVVPGLLLMAIFSGYLMLWALRHPEQVPEGDADTTLAQKLAAGRHLIPVLSLIVLVIGAIYTGIATATESAALGVAGSLGLAALEGSLTWKSFKEGLWAACRVYCMIGLILAGAAFLTLAMGFIGLPREVASFIGGLHLSPFMLLVLLMGFFIVLGCFLDGISMVVLTMAVLLPTVQAAGIDLVWFGIFVVMVVEMAQITPPVGFNLFVLQGLTKREVPYLARTALPFFGLLVAALGLIYVFPQTVLWLPGLM